MRHKITYRQMKSPTLPPPLDVRLAGLGSVGRVFPVESGACAWEIREFAEVPAKNTTETPRRSMAEARIECEMYLRSYLNNE